ncbi:ABC transporter ATP-binding protein [Aquilutibacter rugosus]|uniref:ABC transporter ATP-binding protein n=1 Tax=Aquilutibacter rugosus TaxID=3115820 RepID=UPI002F407E0E
MSFDEMDGTVLDVIGLSKTYNVYAKPHHRLLQSFDSWLDRVSYTKFPALVDVNFSLRRGETVGVVGKNGSGKSTLLQLICGTLTPTVGEINVRGRIAALLELGSGFNPEFSGIDNIHLNASVLGLSRKEIESKLSSIISFADIGDHIHLPVKTYSSGMYIRLAFAVAICTDPDILVIDEALSVGDEAFQRKCFGRIEELKRLGCTILFVSHSAGSIIQLCDRALLLDQGELIRDGDPKSVVALYQKLLYAAEPAKSKIREQIKNGELFASSLSVDDEDIGGSDANDIRPAVADSTFQNERFDSGLVSESKVEYEPNGANIIDPHIVNEAGMRVNILQPGGQYRYRYSVDFSENASTVHFGMMIKSMTGVELFGMSSHPDEQGLPEVRKGSVVEVEFGFKSDFLPGVYFMNAGCTGTLLTGEATFMHRILDGYLFKIEHRATDRKKAGFYDLALEPACTLRVTG